MNPIYFFYYKRYKFMPWIKKKVIGHIFENFNNTPTGSMILYLPDNTIEIIPNFLGKCYMKLGTDWLVAQKKIAEIQAGQQVQTTF